MIGQQDKKDPEAFLSPGHSIVEDIRVSTWNELNEQLYESSWEEPLARFHSNLAFRGLGNSAYDLKTGLIRLGGPERLELDRACAASRLADAVDRLDVLALRSDALCDGAASGL